jgi:hypothetical protein
MNSKCDLCKKTPGEYWAEMKAERVRAFGRPSTDGPLIWLLKLVLGFVAFHRPVESFVKACLNVKKKTNIQIGKDSANSEFNKYFEWYWILWTCVLVCA